MPQNIAVDSECFIVGVIGKAGSEHRIHADWFFEGIVLPTFEEHFKNFKVIRADTMNVPGTITTQIIDKLLNAKLVIADLTFLNPNAFYEIGIRHMAGLPIIHAHQAGEAIPFDVSTFRSMEYTRSEYRQMITARESLRALVDAVLAPNHQVDNPVTQARGRAKFVETATAPDRMLLTQLEALSNRVNAMERSEKSRMKALIPGWPPYEAKRATKFGEILSLQTSQDAEFQSNLDISETLELNFVPMEGTKKEDVDKFVFENVVQYAGEDSEIKRLGDGYSLRYLPGSIDSRSLDELSKLAELFGVHAIPF